MQENKEHFPTTSTVAVVGGGPVGLYLALMLAQANISVVVFEKTSSIVHRPKAAGYFPIVLEEFKQTGIYEDVFAAGHANQILEWHGPKGELLARIIYPNKTFGVQLEQCEVCEIILKHLAKYSNVQVVFGIALVTVEQDSGGVVSTYEREGKTDSGVLQHKSNFLIGADGGKSTVRKQLQIPLEGFTWDDFVVTFNIIYPSKYLEGTFCGANFTVDPELWGVIIKLPSDNWRITFAVSGGEDDPFAWHEEKMLAKIKTVMSKLLPGPIEEAKITAYAPYSMHQRCATTFLQGQVILAGDAAHLTNPIGGLGLTTGLLDAALLGRALKGVILEDQPYTVLEDYAEKRRSVFMNNTSPTATANLKRLRNVDNETARAREEVFAKINSFDPEFMKRMGQQILTLSSTLDVPL